MGEEMASQLYQKQLPVLIRSAGRDDRRAHVWLTMEMERYPGMERGRTLIVRLTDENDLFFPPLPPHDVRRFPHSKGAGKIPHRF